METVTKESVVDAGMPLSQNVQLVRTLFSQLECTFLIVGAASAIVANQRGHKAKGLPPGMTQEAWEEGEAASHAALGKLWVAQPKVCQEQLAAYLLEAFNFRLEVHSSQEDEAPAPQPPGACL